MFSSVRYACTPRTAATVAGPRWPIVSWASDVLPVWAFRPHMRPFFVSPTTEVRAYSYLYATSASTPTGNPTSMVFLSENVSLVGFASPAFARVCPYQRTIRLFLVHVNRQFYATQITHLSTPFVQRSRSQFLGASDPTNCARVPSLDHVRAGPLPGLLLNLPNSSGHQR